MARKLTFRQLLLSILALWYGRSQKEIGAAAGLSQSRVSQLLSRGRLGEIKQEDYERLLAAVKAGPAAVPIVTACLDALAALEEEGDLTAGELGEIEAAARAASRAVRASLAEAARRSRVVPAAGYPRDEDLLPARERAGELLGRLQGLPEEKRPVVVRAAEEFQSWALCESVCAVSTREASRKIERAAAWARLGEEIAARVRGPEGWRLRVQGYAAAHGANVLRVAGELRAADAAFDRARKLWLAGTDPDGVLDPGRLLDLEASLRRDQRRLGEALALLDAAAAVGRCPERLLIKKGFTLEVMGEHERAVAALLQAESLVERSGDPRLLYMLRFNLAVNHCHIGRYVEAAGLVQQVRDLATERGDENEVLRVTWLEGRIAAGQGRRREAQRLLEAARREFERRKMSYDAALALLEQAVLLLDDGRPAEVKALAAELRKLFDSNGVHREALAALRLFHAAAEREEATPELARRVLRFLFQARYDQRLRFES
jgi:tetratricopeptide (TPR) repeat protein